ncbi:MAG TPA: glutamyl-tRNA reductase [Fimbriimonadaceae bacterium]|nr:glutamyl-tRNA reductase [Fimbriimonadaceae bacterium]
MAISHCPFGVIGLSYRTASLDLRGRASFGGDGANHLLQLLRDHGVNEAMVLSTCNRTELYFAGPDHELVIRLFAAAAKTDLDEIRPHIYFKKSLCAACHLFRVVSGLDSAVLGETEIVAQVKNSWKTAEDFGSCGPGLNLLLQRAMEVNKRVRTETDLCRGVTSTATLAVIQAQANVGSLEGRNVVLVGAGQIGERVCKDLRPLNVGRLKILNRTPEKAVRLAQLYGGEVGSLEELEAEMVDADVVITAITSKQPLIDDALISRVGDKRAHAQLLIDLGVPANVQLHEPRADVEVLDIDTLSTACSENLGRRAQAVPVALDLLDEEILRLRTDLTVRSAAPTIKALVNSAEAIRRQNMDWAMERLTDLTAKERKIVEDLSNRIVKGLLQAPIQGLKHELTAAEHREIVSKLFRLEERGDESLAS